jgi:hypothetical protein
MTCRAPARPTVSRELIDPLTGDVHTLIYEETPTSHVIRHEPPFAFPDRGRSIYCPTVEEARIAWKAAEGFLMRTYGLRRLA